MTIMMKQCAAILIALTFYATNQGYAQQNSDTVLSLKQCVDIAVANNLQVKQSELQAEIDYIDLRQARDNRLPQITANLNHGLSQGRGIDPLTNSYINQNIGYGNYDLSGGVTLFGGGQIKNLIKQNLLGLSASRMDLQQVKENIMLNVILAYLQIQNNADLVQQARNQYELTQQQVNRLEILNKEGSIIPAQLYELKGQLANDQLSLINNENALDAARLLLCQLMNIPYKKIVAEKTTASDNDLSYDTDPTSLYVTALPLIPAIKAAVFRRQSLNAAIKYAKGAFYPGISLGGNLYTNFSSGASKDIFQNTVEVPSGDFVDVNGTKVPVITSRNNFNSQKISYFDQFKNNYSTSVSLAIRIPIINYRLARNRVSVAKAQFRNAEFLEVTAKTQLSQNIEQAYFNMTASYKKQKTLLQQVSDFSEAFKIAEVRFNEGATNQVEYLIAKNNLDRANSNLIIARYDYIFRTKILDYYRGKLIL